MCQFGLEPGADSEVLEAMEKAMKVAEKQNDYTSWEAIQEGLFLLTKDESYFDKKWHGSDDDFDDDEIYDEETDVPLVPLEDEFEDTCDDGEKKDRKKGSGPSDDDEGPF